MAKNRFGVLILHGLSASLDCVREIEPPLKALGLPTRMPVLRGHNAESPEALRGVTWQDWVSDATLAFNDLNSEAERVIVIGHSMGGLMALILASEHSEIIDSIILAAAAVKMNLIFAPGRPLNFLVPLLKIGVKKIDISTKHYADSSLAQYDTNYLWLPAESVIALFDLIKLTRKRLPEVKTPALIIQSHNDSSISAESVDMIYKQISIPIELKRVIWFEKTEHEMFRDCERQGIINVMKDYIVERINL